MDRYNPPDKYHQINQGFWTINQQSMNRTNRNSEETDQDFNNHRQRKLTIKYLTKDGKSSDKEVHDDVDTGHNGKEVTINDNGFKEYDDGNTIKQCDIVAKKIDTKLFDDNSDTNKIDYGIKTLFINDNGVIINGLVYISKIKWNTLVIYSGSEMQSVHSDMYICAVCREGVALQEENEHSSLERHKRRLQQCPPLVQFAENVVRKISEKEVHCGVCNVIKTDVVSHIADSFHKLQYDYALQSARTHLAVSNSARNTPNIEKQDNARCSSRPATPNKITVASTSHNLNQQNNCKTSNSGNVIQSSIPVSNTTTLETTKPQESDANGLFKVPMQPKVNLSREKFNQQSDNWRDTTNSQVMPNFKPTPVSVANNFNNPNNATNSQVAQNSNHNNATMQAPMPQIPMNTPNNFNPRTVPGVLTSNVFNSVNNAQISQSNNTNNRIFQMQNSVNCGMYNSNPANQMTPIYGNVNNFGNIGQHLSGNQTNSSESYPPSGYFGSNMNYGGFNQQMPVNSNYPPKTVNQNAQFNPNYYSNIINTAQASASSDSRQIADMIANANLTEEMSQYLRRVIIDIAPQFSPPVGAGVTPNFINSTNQVPTNHLRNPMMMDTPSQISPQVGVHLNQMPNKNPNIQQSYFTNTAPNSDMNAKIAQIFNNPSQFGVNAPTFNNMPNATSNLKLPTNFINFQQPNIMNSNNFNMQSAGNGIPNSNVGNAFAGNMGNNSSMMPHLNLVSNNIPPGTWNYSNNFNHNIRTPNSNAIPSNQSAANTYNYNFAEFYESKLNKPATGVNNNTNPDSNAVNKFFENFSGNNSPIPGSTGITNMNRNISGSNNSISNSITGKSHFQDDVNIKHSAIYSSANNSNFNSLSGSNSSIANSNRATPQFSSNYAPNSGIGNSFLASISNANNCEPASSAIANPNVEDTTLNVFSKNSIAENSNKLSGGSEISHSDIEETDEKSNSNPVFFNTKMAKLAHRSLIEAVQKHSIEPTVLGAESVAIDNCDADSENEYRETYIEEESDDSSVYDIVTVEEPRESTQNSQTSNSEFWDCTDVSEIRSNEAAPIKGFWECKKTSEVTTVAASMEDFPALKKPNFSAVAAIKPVAIKSAETSSYANMISKKDPPTCVRRESKYIIVTVARKRYIIRSDYYHTLIDMTTHWYCMACEKNMAVEGTDAHKASERHVKRMAECKLMDQHKENMIRWLNTKFIHCAVCNILTLEHQLENHCRLDIHKRLLADILAMPSLEKVKRQEEADRVVAAYLTSLGGFADEGSFEQISPIDTKIIVTVFGSNIMVSLLAYNGIITYEDGPRRCFRCVICFDVLQLLMVSWHCERPDHRTKVARAPFTTQHGLDLIRPLNKKSLHCAICNMMLQNTPQDVASHMGTNLHTIKRRQALAAAVGQSATTLAPPQHTHISIATVQNPAPIVSSTPDKKRSIKEKKVVQQTKPKERADTPLYDYAASLNVGAPYLITHRRRCVLLPSYAWHGIHAEKGATPCCRLCRTGGLDDVEKHCNSTGHDTELMACELMQTTDREFLREITAEQVQCLTCNKMLSRSSLDEHCAEVRHRARLAEASKAAEHPPDHAICHDFSDPVDDNDMSHQTCLLVHKNSLLVSWSAWHGIVTSGGSARCLMCARGVDEARLRQHAVSADHVQQTATCRIQEPHCIRRLKSAYHCITCNMVVQIPQLVNHLKKHVHLKAYQEALENSAFPNTNTEVILLNEYMKEDEKEEKSSDNLNKKGKKKGVGDTKESKDRVEKTESVKDDVQDMGKVSKKVAKLTKKEKKKIEAQAIKAKEAEQPKERKKPRLNSQAENKEEKKVANKCIGDENGESNVKANWDTSEDQNKTGNSETTKNVTDTNEKEKKLAENENIVIEKENNTTKKPADEVNEPIELVSNTEITQDKIKEVADKTVRYTLTVVKPEVSADLNQKYDIPKKILLLKISENISLCISCSSEVPIDTITEHVMTENHIIRTSKNLAKFSVEIPQAITKRGISQDTTTEPAMYFVQADNNAYSVVVRASVWHCLAENPEGPKCMLCNVLVTEAKLEKHKYKTDHQDKLKSILDSDDGNLIRKLGDNIHCITCDTIMPASEMGQHLKDSLHLQQLKEAFETTTRPNLKITQIVRISDYVMEKKDPELPRAESRDVSEVRHHSESEEEEDNYNAFAIVDEGKKNTARCLPCNETVPSVLLKKHLRSKKHIGKVANCIKLTLLNPLLSTEIKLVRNAP